jgi:hypothetical protein
MKLRERQDFRQVALRMLEKGAEPRFPREFIDEVRQTTGATEREVLDALWYLIDRGQVTLTADRRLTVVDAGEPVAHVRR